MDPQAPQRTPQGARCALHAGQPFTAVCRRCGTYMCQHCTEGGKLSICPECRRRLGVGTFPLHRSAFRLGEVLGHAYRAYTRNWLVISAAVLLSAAAIGLAQGASALAQMLLMDDPLLGLAVMALLVIPQILVQGLVTLGVLNLGVQVARGERAQLDMLITAWRKLGPFLLQGVLLNTALVAGLMVTLLPAFAALFLLPDASALALKVLPFAVPVLGLGFAYLALGVAFAGVEIVAQPHVGAIEGIKTSWAIARAQRMVILWGLLVAALAVGLGFMLCGVGAVFGAGYACVLYATLYLTLRNGLPQEP